MFRSPLARAAGVVGFALALVAPAPAQPDRYAPIVGGLSARCIGPANMGGRVTELAVVESDPNIYYVATAGGGVWKTTDGGATLRPVFDAQPTQSIGAIDLCQAKPDVVFVGTGEGNPRNSVSPGAGVFRSVDGGKTWAPCRLKDTHHIGRIAVHPENPDIAYVAAIGHFWGPNKERGLFKTSDGGKTWDCVNFIDESTGFVDVQLDPSDPDTLYAAAWQVRRDAFAGGSPVTQTSNTGGLFKSTDAGKTWAKMAGGLPEGAYGRCGLAVSRKTPAVVFAIIQTGETAGAFGNGGQPATPIGKDGNPGAPGKVETGGVFRSADRGKTWAKVNDLVPRPFYYGQIRTDPTNAERVYVLGVTLRTSADGGKTFTTLGRTIHADQHALWVNPKNPKHLIVGNDGGLYTSKDGGQTFTANRGLVIGQFYGVAVDTRTPYRVYGGLQDNGSWGGPTATPYEDGITLSDWHRLLGADGFQAAVDPADPYTVYVESQYGGLTRASLRSGPKGPVLKPIRPPVPKGGPPTRYNWNAPILLSPHDPKTLYYGAQHLYKSVNRGDSWEKISADLTAPPKGAPSGVGHSILTLAESPVQAGVLWVGTDDGNVWVSKNGGKEWANVSANIPGPRARAVAKIECSHFTAGTALVAIDRHRNDDFKPYLYVTLDYGETWKPFAGNLPNGAVVGAVRQSSKNRFLLFAGTELGLFVTFDAGLNWHHVTNSGMPGTVRVDDLVIHPRERELVIGTHGRGVWVMDIAPLEQLTETALATGVHLFDLRPVVLVPPTKRALPPPAGFKAPNPPARPVVSFLVGPKGAEKVTFTYKGADQEVTNELADLKPGIHTLKLNPLPPGEHTITMKAGGVTQVKTLTVKAAEEVPKQKANE
ncbi:MAG TPA: hypothetical protein VGE74_20980 [Gemmata sp.]